MSQLIWVLLIGVLLFITHKNKISSSHIVLYRITLGYTALLFLAWLVQGGPDGSKFLWLYIFPSIAMFALGRREGLIWNLVMFTLIAILLTGVFEGLTYPYSADTVLRFFVSYTVVFLISFFFETVRTYFHIQNVENVRHLELAQNEAEAANLRLKKVVHEKESLMQEMHLRVRNNLSMIGAMLEIKAQKLGDQAALDDVRYQVQALRNVHDKLHQVDDAGDLEFKPYIKGLLKNLFASSPEMGIDLELEIEGVDLRAEQIIPLGLITNEIATNAVKHGFNPERRNRFFVKMVREPATQELVYLLANDGAPMKDTPTAPNETMGLNLVRMLVDQLNGTFEIMGSPTPSFVITLPPEPKKTDK